MLPIANAHVKWFADFDFGDRPLPLDDAITPAFIALAAVSAIVIAVLAALHGPMHETRLYRRIDAWLAARREKSLLVLRVGTGAVMLLSWQADALLVPELAVGWAWLGWLQFVVAFLLLFDATVPLAGAGLLTLFAIAVGGVGPFHMLDYALYAGVGYHLLVSGATDLRIRDSALPALYLTVGFSLCWVALEKVIYPQWGLYLLAQNPRLALGFDIDFFLLAAAFIEFALGYLLIINVLERPLALTVTLVFFLTTLVFGKIEVIGHTLIHAALIVFLLEGPGRTFRPPIAIHRRTSLRMAFAAVNFLLLLLLLLPLYHWGAVRRYRAGSERVSTWAGPVGRAPLPSGRSEPASARSGPGATACAARSAPACPAARAAPDSASRRPASRRPASTHPASTVPASTTPASGTDAPRDPAPCSGASDCRLLRVGDLRAQPWE
ncbi:MAG: hypothetical protein ACRELV_04300 [Longimicrobiales bacterium]